MCNFIQQQLRADDFQIPPHREAVDVGRNKFDTHFAGENKSESDQFCY
jgi:hypothetical protein